MTRHAVKVVLLFKTKIHFSQLVSLAANFRSIFPRKIERKKGKRRFSSGNKDRVVTFPIMFLPAAAIDREITSSTKEPLRENSFSDTTTV